MSHKVTIVRANKMGFCFGVMKAVRLCEDILQDPKNVNKKKYILGMLVHNDFVVQNFEKKGFITIEESEIPFLKKGDIVVIRAHGITKEIQRKLEEKDLELYDATCVFVSHIKWKILWAMEQGYDILFLGDKDHPEVKGITSYAENIQIFSELEELKAAKILKDRKYFLSTQTTLHQKKFLEIKKYLEEYYPNVYIFNKICGATQERQKATEILAREVDIVFVLGGKKSSNTKKLYEISKSINPNTYLLENEEDLEEACLQGKHKIGLTAGASTPEEIIRNIENKIRGILDA
ncbi:4-hydroxy-3-methylbut-2-enyl diphosphate reductase [Fusobacterium necrophorum]|uniref:4-hydroxy-3-methylbut-2-enyl diphosphate reductase n=1 Tax=Fusobacterium necrophorum DJ-2 TaxID=1441737 RepID=A0AB73C3J4_9FUSO|nr:4-hydroxy-3-methylbut-2-enyl diphosphate reductase [Fusobacterium necrophorum]KDE67044.1 hydroxymethylbutenyl pyrophosphate reductase [Fusobacterium necrophorum DJ-1]KDE72463.1 hydroxymethylbutenyl pyrophosphate reductase [Fusobacterium necrophorum DJ-2]